MYSGPVGQRMFHILQPLVACDHHDLCLIANSHSSLKCYSYRLNCSPDHVEAIPPPSLQSPLFPSSLQSPPPSSPKRLGTPFAVVLVFVLRFVKYVFVRDLHRTDFYKFYKSVHSKWFLHLYSTSSSSNNL